MNGRNALAEVLLAGLLFTVGCTSWPIAVHDGLPAYVPETGTHELRWGPHILFPPGSSGTENRLGFYPLLAYRTAFGLGPLALELGAGAVHYIEETTLGGYKSEVLVAGPEFGLGRKRPALTLRLAPLALALNFITADRHTDVFPSLKPVPLATALCGFGNGRRGWSGCAGVRASPSAFGPVLLGQFAFERIFFRPEASLMFRSPWAESTILDQPTATIGATIGLDLTFPR